MAVYENRLPECLQLVTKTILWRRLRNISHKSLQLSPFIQFGEFVISEEEGQQQDDPLG